MQTAVIDGFVLSGVNQKNKMSFMHEITRIECTETENSEQPKMMSWTDSTWENIPWHKVVLPMYFFLSACST